jgi:valyl-tRNA synthetase
VNHDEMADLERARLERDLAEAEAWLAAARERLANEAFVSRAPASVVDAARAREAELADQVSRLRDRLAR